MCEKDSIHNPAVQEEVTSHYRPDEGLDPTIRRWDIQAIGDRLKWVIKEHCAEGKGKTRLYQEVDRIVARAQKVVKK